MNQGYKISVQVLALVQGLSCLFSETAAFLSEASAALKSSCILSLEGQVQDLFQAYKFLVSSAA